MALGKDLERHLNKLPVTAAAPTVGYRLLKFVTRHRAEFSRTAAGFLVAAFLFSGLLIWRSKSLRRGPSLQSPQSASGLVEAPYFTFVTSARGLNVGDPVMLMGLKAGNITDVEPMPPDQFAYDVFVKFVLKEPYHQVHFGAKGPW